MINKLRQYIYNRRCDKALDEALRLSTATGRKYFVVIMKGKPMPVTKQYISKMVKLGKFKKGVTVREIEKQALFVTAPTRTTKTQQLCHS